MARPILMPQVGQDLTEGKIVAINVKLGDKVKKGDIVAEVESEKATFEVEAFETGTVIDLPFKVGDIAIVLKPLMMVGDEGEVVEAAAKPSAPQTALSLHQLESWKLSAQAGGKAGSSPLARGSPGEAGVDIAQVTGSGTEWCRCQKRSCRSEACTFRRQAPNLTTSPTGVRSLQTGTGDPVLFIHGFGADLSAWRPFILHLGISNPVLALDLPAHGANANKAADNFEALIAAAHAAITHAGLDRLHLVGHSVGAAVAAHLAGGGDLDVRSLTMIAPAGLGPKINGDFIAGFLASKTEPALKVWLGELVHKPAMLPGALLRATFAAREGTAMVANQLKLAAGLFSGNTQLFSIHDALERYTGATRVIVGKDDRIISPDDVDKVPPHVAVNRLSSVGHYPQLEAATLTARLVAETVRSAGTKPCKEINNADASVAQHQSTGQPLC